MSSIFAPDYYKAIEPTIKAQAGQPPPPPPPNVLEARDGFHAFMATIKVPVPKEIVEKRFDIDVPGGTKVAVYRYATAEQLASKDQPAVLYLHAGGMVLGTIELMGGGIATESLAMGLQYWAVDYTLSPEVTAPVALEEAYAALTYIHTNAAQLGIDPKRIAVTGASAGGGMTASIGLMARDRQLSPPLAKLVMVYPMLDDRTVHAHPPKGARYAGANTGDDDWALRPFLTWTCEHNALGWAAYLGAGDAKTQSAQEAAAALAKATTSSASYYAVPARVPSLRGLPSSYIDVGGLDLYLEEDTQFAARLARDGVEFDFHVFYGVPHGFELVPDSDAAKTARELRRKAFHSF